MNKVLIIILVLIVLGGIGYYVMKGNGSYQMGAPTPTQATMAPAGSSGTGAAMGKTKEFTVSGNEFAFSPATLTVAKGDTVKVTFTNNGTYPHNFTIKEFNVVGKTVAPGQSDTVTFIANQTGVFQYYCSVDSHKDKGMVGTLTVQ